MNIYIDVDKIQDTGKDLINFRYIHGKNKNFEKLLLIQLDNRLTYIKDAFDKIIDNQNILRSELTQLKKKTLPSSDGRMQQGKHRSR